MRERWLVDLIAPLMPRAVYITNLRHLVHLNAMVSSAVVTLVEVRADPVLLDILVQALVCVFRTAQPRALLIINADLIRMAVEDI